MRNQLRAAVRATPQRTLVALDFDGTLAPIVGDPERAAALPAAVQAMARLAPLVGTLAVITGRPPQQAVRLGGFAGQRGLEDLLVLGHYGAARWEAGVGEVAGVDRGPSLDALIDALPATLDAANAPNARVEDKGAAVAVHTRGLAAGTFERLLGPLATLAEAHRLKVEPGREVIELRPPGVDKGDALRGLVAEFEPEVVIFAGDDLGDLPAFAALKSLDIVTFGVFSSSSEQPAIADHADLVVAGPAGVAHWLAELADALE